MTENPNPFPTNGVRPLYTTAFAPKPDGAYFNTREADRAVAFFRYLKHSQGPLAGQRFELTPEQVWVVREAFGWYRADGVRLYRTVYIEVGRGNGKSQLGAGIAGKLLFADGELNPEVVGAASDRRQATKICLNRLKAMVRSSPDLTGRADILQREIRAKATIGETVSEGFYEATSSDVASAWGGSPHGLIVDELHTQPNRDLWDALVTGMGKRRQPMAWALTTAGWDRESLAWEMHELTRQVQESEVRQENFLGVVWAAPEDDDWTSPETWRRANPMLESEDGSGVTVSGAPAAITISYLRGECEKAKAIPAFQNTFRTMYLSQWVGQEVRFIPLDVWDKNTDAPQPGKRVAFGGLDLASTTDLAAFTVVSMREDKVDVDVHFWAPEEGLRERMRRDKVPYDVWAREGLLTLTPGATIRHESIRQAVNEAAVTYNLKDVGYDRWNSSELVTNLVDDGIEMVDVGQGMASMSAPTKELLRLVLEKKLRHGGNPVLRWMVNNTAAVVDAAGNVKPDKKKSASRIDGVVSTIIAIDGLMRRGQQPEVAVSRWNKTCPECGHIGGSHNASCSRKVLVTA